MDGNRLLEDKTADGNARARREQREEKKPRLTTMPKRPETRVTAEVDQGCRET
jgi:hypothetical protein